MKEVSALRPVTGARKVFDAHLLDGAIDPTTGKLKIMKTTLFGDEAKANENYALAEKCKDYLLPVTFLMLQGSKEDDKFMFSSARKGMRMVEAMPADKADRLTINAAEWFANGDNTQAFEQKEFVPFVARDYSAEPGIESTCKLLSLLSRHESGITALDGEESFWQLN